MSIFQRRHTNYFCLHIFSQWKQSLCNGRNGTVWVFWGRCQTQLMVLMTSSVIALLLLLTPALKNNIWQACHYQTLASQHLGLSVAQQPTLKRTASHLLKLKRKSWDFPWLLRISQLCGNNWGKHAVFGGFPLLACGTAGYWCHHR